MKLPICITTLVLLFGTSPSQTKRYEGSWHVEGPQSEFSLKLKQEGNKISGSHCSIQQAGNRMDCGLDESDVSITGIVRDSAVVTFTSFYGDGSGKAVIKRISETSIEWKVIKAPQGEFYIPLRAVLTKQ